MTVVINLYGGAGVGKSTIAALLFAHMKMAKYHTELVREYVKLWAWSGRQVRPTDQLYLLGKQSAYESALYGKVDYVVTDSPVLLAGAYAEWQSGEDGKYVTEAARKFYETSEQLYGVTYLNVLISRKKEYDPRGRYGTAEEAAKFDIFLEQFLHANNKGFAVVAGNEHENIEQIFTLIDQF